MSEDFDSLAAKMKAVDVGMVVAFSIITALAIWFQEEKFYYYLVSFFSYAFSKVIATQICSYEKFAAFIRDQMLRSGSAVMRMDGFSLFKYVLIFFVAVGYVFVSPWILVAEAILVVSMRRWAAVYE